MWRRKRKSKMSRGKIAGIVASARPDLSPQEQARFVDLIVESMGMTAKELTQHAKFNEALIEIGMKKGLAKPGATVGDVLTEKDVLKAKLIATSIRGGKESD